MPRGLSKCDWTFGQVLSENKYVSHGHSSSKLTSRHDSRKHGVTDGRVTKKHGGLGYASRNKSMERGVKESRLLTPSYIYENATSVPKPVQESKLQDPVEKPKDKPQSMATPTERYNELSPLMTKMVEEELRDIMINMWQVLPDDTSNEAEKLVVNKLRGATGDDIRNTIGLNATKRLLNVHNGILVKVVLHSAVAPSEIQAFAKKYHITDFKHVQRWTYAGRMASWTDLDDLYAHKDLKCGTSCVTVSPVYSFMKCPSNLRTIFDGKQNYSNSKKIEQEAARKLKKPEGRVIVTADKVLAEVARKVIAKKDKVSDTKVKNNTEQSKVESISKSKTEAANNENVKKTVEKHIDKKTSDAKQSAPTEINTPKGNEIKTATKVKTNAANTAKNEFKTESQPNKVETAITVVKRPSVTTNTPKQKVATQQTNATKVEKVKAVAHKPVATNTPKNDIVPPIINASKVETPKKVANESAVTDKIIASPKPIATKTEPTKAALKNPSVSTNTPNKNIASPKQNAPKPDANKAVITPPESTNNPKKEIVSPKPKKPVVTAKLELTKALVKEPAKLATNKPVTANLAKKETLTPKTIETKKPEVKAAKVEPTRTKAQPNMVAFKPVTTNTPKKDSEKPKLTENRKSDTKFTKVAPKSPANPKTNSKMNAKKKAENDFDELDDRDILALLSSGIVLDECSGSGED